MHGDDAPVDWLSSNG
jgi:excisionase family DNA binding protein